MQEGETGSHDTASAPEDETKTALALAVILHDIRTPLGAVSATADLLAATELDQHQRAYVDTLQQAAAALNDLTTELLDQAGEVPPEPTGLLVWNPAEALTGLADLFRPLADERKVKLELTLADELDGAATGDPHAVRRILTNLIDNAIKFTGKPHGEPDAGSAKTGSGRTDRRSPRVRVDARYVGEDERHLLVTVSDDGPGIDPQELPTLFLPYRQGASGQRLRSGSGLGLWISRTLAQRLGGRLDVESEYGHGTTFTLEVPCMPVGDLVRDAEEVAADATAPDLVKLRVLVVDDNSVNRLLITTFLDSFGMSFKAVASGAAALEAADEEAFDVVIMDLQMPGMDGIEAALRLRERPEGGDIPIVALTAGMRPSDTARSRKAGFCCVLGKPFAPADLFKALTAAAASRAGEPQTG
ncbi:ATP-binding protein [Breoghania sp.]|uniref:ATP-binding response regulator n=1 Tax=Breoghania sp. TaxID=2065378 RepID=UPI002AA8894B|nr:ATP-binding protein [Breoghania sp.]